MTVNLLTAALWATGLVANALCVGYTLWLFPGLALTTAGKAPGPARLRIPGFRASGR
ncbi:MULTISPECIES: hypothetical protein [Streptomyces]|uniref:Uncharacterized protein n=1 Tax=Streptomyces lonegramiae TaxID=3075524 RepID=A0ABU2X615_9ACTN|nr:hypothetical protein [Streptomyces sp. DSM 41529]MDT0541355.1 hypothetical protein [Streptomyces sp. DSM 41529]